jgi:CMP-N-acetylneuraminic acid synthetase
MKVVALLPMKAHSERIPNKNMRLFGGKPLYHFVAYVLETSSLVATILINTDSDIIAMDARKHFSKVKIIDRPEALRGDFVSMNDIVAYDIHGTEAEHFIQTHSTNPLLMAGTLNKAIAVYFDSLGEHDSLFSVTQLQTRLYWEDGRPINHNTAELLRTQDLPPVFEENSNLYLFSKTSFSEAGNNRIGLKPQMFVMDKLEAIDVDEEEDWKMAEVLLELRKNMLRWHGKDG